MQVAMVEFAVGPDKVDACVAALTDITGNLVALQPVSLAPGCMWRKPPARRSTTCCGTPTDFINFRDSNAERIGEVVWRVRSKGRMIDVVAEIEK